MDITFGLLEWIGCATGLLGSGLLALNTGASRYGFVSFGVSNLAWIGYGLWIGSMGLVVMQLGFCATTTLGLVRWFKRTAEPSPAAQTN